MNVVIIALGLSLSLGVMRLRYGLLFLLPLTLNVVGGIMSMRKHRLSSRIITLGLLSTIIVSSLSIPFEARANVKAAENSSCEGVSAEFKEICENSRLLTIDATRKNQDLIINTSVIYTIAAAILLSIRVN